MLRVIKPIIRVIPSKANIIYQLRAFSESPDNDAKLRADIKMLGQMIGHKIKSEDPAAYESVEKLRFLGREWRAKPTTVESETAFKEMVDHVRSLDNNKLFLIARTFAHFLAMSNRAENHHRIRRRFENIKAANSSCGISSSFDSCGTIFDRLVKQGVRPQDIINTLTKQKVEIVLTAHPTEVNRRTNLQKYQRVEDLLVRSDIQDRLIPYERKQIFDGLQREIASLWASDELMRAKPTPVDEAKMGLAIIENVLWKAVPQFYRKLDDTLFTRIGGNLPLDASPIKFASWMGGDRDGNPNVTPAITYKVSMLSRWTAAHLLKGDIQQLKSELSIQKAGEQLRNAVSPNSKEPYREVLQQLDRRLDSTLEWSSARAEGKVYMEPSDEDLKPLKHTSEILEPLKMLYNSLLETGHKEIADGSIKDTLRRLAAFGLALSPLDIRQESHKHSEALDAITRYLGVGSYLQWDEATRRNWLQVELNSKRSLLPKNVRLSDLGFSPTVLDTLGIFELAASIDQGSLGAYVISQCQYASDILAVALLQKDAGVSPMLRVVPLFETLDDLERSASTVEALFSIATYRGLIGGHQEIMVGYSDSAKDAGRLAASWALYKAQEAIANIGLKHDVKITFFHGKGGTVGRGGNPALYKAILAHPPHTINGRFRVTEQGEMITQNFGQITTAERTLDLFTAGVLAEQFEPRATPSKEWRECMERLSTTSCQEYRYYVREDPRFVPYFRTATPELELAGLNVGSRPAKRNPNGGVESLRAIPWIFSWTQTRLNLPTWLGVGSALSKELHNACPSQENVLRDMNTHWTWFRTMIDLIDLICVKSDARIAQNYDDELVHDASSKELGLELRRKLTETSKAVLELQGTKILQEQNPILLRSLAVRNPYVDPLNVIQAELLRRLRATGDCNITPLSVEEKRVVQDALLITINGVANGMRNSG